MHSEAIMSVVILGVATGTVSMTLSKTKLFAPVREWVTSKSRHWGHMIKCPYCTSFWVALGFMGWYQPIIITSSFFVADWITTWFVVVFVSSSASGLIRICSLYD